MIKKKRKKEYVRRFNETRIPQILRVRLSIVYIMIHKNFQGGELILSGVWNYAPHRAGDSSMVEAIGRIHVVESSLESMITLSPTYTHVYFQYSKMEGAH